jgi:hypothetical protein
MLEVVAPLPYLNHSPHLCFCLLAALHNPTLSNLSQFTVSECDCLILWDFSPVVLCLVILHIHIVIGDNRPTVCCQSHNSPSSIVAVTRWRACKTFLFPVLVGSSWEWFYYKDICACTAFWRGSPMKYSPWAAVHLLQWCCHCWGHFWNYVVE